MSPAPPPRGRSIRFPSLPATLPLLARETVLDFRRNRAAEAIALVAHREGVAELTVSQITMQTRMSRATFYQLFASRSEGVRFALQVAFTHLFGELESAGDRSRPWLERLDLTLARLFATIAAEPQLAELCLVHSASLPAEAEGCDFGAAVDAMAQHLRGGREEGRAALGERYRDPSPQTEDFLASAIVSLAALRLKQGNASLLPSHREELVYLAATSFFGPKAASAAIRDLQAARPRAERAA